ncbi:uncharacterized protein LOC121416781 [Lytechinus variegatus]|uniref:uncharacterized protein LOC121416781 n=1 Tax=Lytechinus variegatus TaxID=7654 RepID=UPI001BB10C85|nr:uncharacterized protein LOC121416781 [Lytechinus variegatus]
MGSAASARKIPPADKFETVEPVPDSAGTATESNNKTDGSPGKPQSTDSTDPAESETVQTDGGTLGGNSDGSLGPTDTISDALLVDFADVKLRRQDHKIRDKIKQRLVPVKESIQYIRECNEFSCTLCNKHMRDINLFSRDSKIGLTAAADAMGIDTNHCKMFNYTWTKGTKLKEIEDAQPSEELPSEIKEIFTFYMELLGSTWNFTDKSDFFCLQLEEDRCLSVIVDWLLHLGEKGCSMNKWVEDMVFDAMNILENACRRLPPLAPRHHRAVPAIQKLCESTDSLTQTVAFMTLARLVKKEEADKLSTNYECIVSLLSLLEKCLSDPKHHTKVTRRTSKKRSTVICLAAIELLQAVEELAINDNNKQLIVAKGGIPILGKLLEPKCSKEEKTSAANTIWRLAFLKENKEKLRKEQSIIYNVTENSQSEHENLRTACMGALFEIYESRLPEGLKNRKTANESPQRAPVDTAKSTGHIMLSYKWEHPSKPVMREFKKELRKRGYTVWMDEDHMMGDKIGAMSEAVENADMVIACITRGYQDSQDCRTEASYAYECKKKIIPVKVMDDFKASGWLGGITAGKIYYIVQKPELVSRVLPSIIEKEFTPQRDIVQNTKDVTPGLPPPEQELKPPQSVSQVPGWDAKRVQDWLAANNVTTRNKALKAFNGVQLLQLKKQLSTAPQTFYQSMKDDLKVPYPDVLSLAAALEHLD